MDRQSEIKEATEIAAEIIKELEAVVQKHLDISQNEGGGGARFIALDTATRYFVKKFGGVIEKCNTSIKEQAERN